MPVFLVVATLNYNEQVVPSLGRVTARDKEEALEIARAWFDSKREWKLLDMIAYPLDRVNKLPDLAKELVSLQYTKMIMKEWEEKEG